MSAELHWRVSAESPPTVTRHCPRCEGRREFISTEKFRVNGQQSRIDVWLIYQCRVCKFTWKLTIFTRVLPSSIDPALFDAFTSNDAPTAERYARDEALIRRCGATVEAGTSQLEGPEVDWEQDSVRIELEIEPPLQIRLDAVLAKKLGVSRRQIEQLVEQGAIRGADGKKLPKKLTQRATIEIAPRVVRALRET